MAAENPPLLFTSIACVLRATAPRAAELKHVIAYIDALLDVSVLVSLEKAASKGSVPFFKRVLGRLFAREASSMDGSVREAMLGKAMHAAVEHGHLEIVQQLHYAHPERLPVRALREAAAKGNFPMLRWLLAHRVDELCIPSPIGAHLHRHGHGQLRCCLHHVFQWAIRHRQFHIVRWLHEQGLVEVFPGVGDIAASEGDLDMVRWCYAQNVRRMFSSKAIDDAARNGHLEIVQFLVANRSEGCTAAAVNGCILEGHDEILAFLRASGVANENVSWELVSEAAVSGRLDILQWDHYAMHDVRYLDSAMTRACEYGHLHVVQWLATKRKIPCRVPGLCLAAERGHLAILQWVHDEGCGVWSATVMNCAIHRGHLDVVQWLHANRNEDWNAFAMDIAAGSGHLEIVKWFHANLSERSTQPINRAAGNGQLEIIQWLHENRADDCTTVAMDCAAVMGHLHVVKWLHDNRTEGCTTKAMDEAAARGHLEIVLWLHTHRHEGCTTKAMDFASSLPIVKFLHNHRTEGCTTNAMDGAARVGDLGKLLFLHEHRTEGCTAEAAVQATRNGHLYIVQWLQKTYPHRFDMPRVGEAARKAKCEAILKWLADDAAVGLADSSSSVG